MWRHKTMTKKNLKPQQAAPVQREINTTASHGTGLMMTPHSDGWRLVPFAGDDVE
jgi:prenylated cyclic peptide (anacyclamide/piricyclamide family)